jgi:hypothetical protein
MTSFSFASTYIGNLPDLIHHFERVKMKLDEDMSAFVISFASYYFDALDLYFKGQSCSNVWKFMFSLGEQYQLPRFVYLLLGVHAHINHDLSLCVMNLGFRDSFKKDYLAINQIIEGKLAEAIMQLHEKSAVLKGILTKGLFIYKRPVHQFIVLCRNLAWEKSQLREEVVLAYH